MSSELERRIDDLYKAPLDQFVAARGALAKTLDRDEARTVKALAKPTVVPWAVNQVHWHRRPVYDRLLKSGARRRVAEVTALGGGRADVASATDAHRQAIAEATRAATELAAASGVRVDRDALTRMFEAVSLATDLAEAPGRLTRPVGPAGFEALAGLAVVAGGGRPAPRPAAVDTPAARRAKAEEEQRAADERRAAAARRRQAAIEREEATLATARRAEMRAKASLEQARKQVAEAEQRLIELRQAADDED